MIANQLGLTRKTTVDKLIVGNEDVRLEVHENTINALLNSSDSLTFKFNKDFLERQSGQVTKEDKKAVFSFEAEAIISNVNISFTDGNAQTSSNTIHLTFTAMVKMTLTSLKITLWKLSSKLEAGFSTSSCVHGEGVMTSKQAENRFEIKASQAIADCIDIKVYKFRNFNFTNRLSSWIVPGPLNLSQVVPLIGAYTTTAERTIETRANIIGLTMQAHNQRIILSFQLSYSTAKKELT